MGETFISGRAVSDIFAARNEVKATLCIGPNGYFNANGPRPTSGEIHCGSGMWNDTDAVGRQPAQAALSNLREVGVDVYQALCPDRTLNHMFVSAPKGIAAAWSEFRARGDSAPLAVAKTVAASVPITLSNIAIGAARDAGEFVFRLGAAPLDLIDSLYWGYHIPQSTTEKP